MPRSIRALIRLLVACSLAACGGSESEPAVTLTIPVQPISSGLFGGQAEVTSEGVRIDSTLELAFGNGYPSEFLHQLPDRLFAACGVLTGEVSLREVTTGASTAADASIDANQVRYVVRDAGVADVLVTGEYVHDGASCPDLLAAGARVPLVAHVRVVVRRPASASIVLPSDCRDASAARVATSARLIGFAPQLVDGEGVAFHAQNATQDAQAEVVVRAHEDVALDPTLPVTLSALVVPVAAGTIEIIPSPGAPLDVRVVDASFVTDVEVAFQVPGVAAVSIVLESGDVVRGVNRANNRIVPTAMVVSVGGDPLCSTPDSSWFELTSMTSLVCEVQPYSFSHNELLIGGAPLGAAALLRANGLCSVELRAPDLDGGAGRTWALSATIEDVEFFTEMEPVAR